MGHEKSHDSTFGFGGRYNLLVVNPGSLLNAMVATTSSKIGTVLSAHYSYWLSRPCLVWLQTGSS
jgi:hypothetical protein